MGPKKRSIPIQSATIKNGAILDIIEHEIARSWQVQSTITDVLMKFSYEWVTLIQSEMMDATVFNKWIGSHSRKTLLINWLVKKLKIIS